MPTANGKGVSSAPRRRIHMRTILAGLLALSALAILSSLYLFSLLSEEEAHEVFSRAKVWKSELDSRRLRSSGGSLLAKCTLSQPVFFFTTDGAINVAAELGRSCPEDAFVVMRRAPVPQEEGLYDEGWGASSTAAEEDALDSSAAAVTESLAYPAATLAKALVGEAEWRARSSVESLCVGHLSAEELLAAADLGHGANTGPTVAYMKTQLVILREARSSTAGSVDHVELARTKLVTLRAALPGDDPARYRHKSVRAALISDSQSGVSVFRDLLGHITHSGTIAEEDAAGKSASREGAPGAGPAASGSPGSNAAPENDSEQAAGKVEDQHKHHHQHHKHVGGHHSSIVYAWAAYYLGRSTAGPSYTSKEHKGDSSSSSSKQKADGAHDEPCEQRLSGPARPLDFLVHGGDSVQSSTDPREAFMYLLAPISDFYSRWGPTGLEDGLGYAVPVVLIRGNHDDPVRFIAYTVDPDRWPQPSRQGGNRDGAAADAADAVAREEHAAHMKTRAGAAATAAVAAASTGTVATPPSYFQLRWGSSLRIIVADTSDESEAQVEWLKRVVCERASAQAASSTNTLAFAHVPPYTEYWAKETWDQGESRWSDYSRLRLLPVLMATVPGSKQGSADVGIVDVLVSGHSHIYQRGSVERKLRAGEEAGKDPVPTPHSCKAPGTPDDPLAMYAPRPPPMLLTTIGGGGGWLEGDKSEGGMVHDSGHLSVTAVRHHFVLLESEATGGGGGGGPSSASLEWMAKARDGLVIDRFTTMKMHDDSW